MHYKRDETVSHEHTALLKERLVKRETELARTREEFHSEQAQRVAGEKELIRLQERLKYQQALIDHQRTALEQDIAEKEARIRDLERSLLAQREEAAEIRRKLAESTLACRAAAEQSLSQGTRIAQFEQTVAKKEKQLKTAEETLVKARGEAAGIRSRLNEANLKYRAVTVQVAEIQAKLDEANLKYRVVTEQSALLKERIAEAEAALAKTREDARGEVAEIRAELDDANLKYRAVSERAALLKERISQTSTELAELHAAADTLQRSKEELAQDKKRLGEENRSLSEQLKLQALQSKKAVADLNAQVERLRQQKLAAENQVAKTRATVSFQLGYLLIHGFKSFKAFKALPGQLAALRLEAGRRKAEKKKLEVRVNASQPPRVWTAPASPEPGAAPTLPPRLSAASVPTLSAFSDFAGSLKELRVACIMDEFTFSSYRHECNLLQLSPQQWRQELDGFTPELLCIESAWRGKDELWGSKVGHMSAELVGIVEWCRQRNVPTVFWNKEDPVHFETFLNTAKLFDYVFTTDIDCIHRYKGALGHDRVYLLPFACQPRTTNPIETYERKDAFCFAGAYYVRYPERTRDLGNFVSTLAALRPVEIYDRNYGKSDPNYQFPPEYHPFIVGNLPFDQIDRAYKGYRYAINLNSIKQSQSMFARRVFELLASNTITVSNFSRGVRLLFGGLVVTTDDGGEVMRRLEALGADDTAVRKFRLAGLRKVMQEHTYQDRLAYIVSKVQGRALPSLLPRIAVTSYAKNSQQLSSLLESFARQGYPHKRLLVVTAGGFTPENVPSDENIKVFSASSIDGVRVRGLIDDAGYVAAMVPDDYYGPNYLTDLALASRYSSAAALGKVTHHVWSHDAGLTIASAGEQYRPATAVAVRAALAKRGMVDDLLLRDWIITLHTRRIEAAEVLGIDEFNYCKNGNTPEFLSTWAETVNDLAGLDTGLAMDELIRRAEGISPAVAEEGGAPVLTGAKLATYFKPPTDRDYKLTVSGTAWEVESSLADGKHDYLYAATDVTPAELGHTGHVQFHLDVLPGLDLQMVLYFLDAQKQRISSVVKTANRNHEAEIPAGAAFVRFGLRIYGSGSARVNALVLGHRPLRPAAVIGRAEHLVLTNQYPAYDDLYRNSFIHSRVAAYRKLGTRVDVFRLRSAESLSYHEFHDVDVITGSQEALHKLLTRGRYRSVLVHFLDEEMWQVLEHHIEQIKILVWVHGAEIQPWHRRDYNYETEQQRNAAKLQSEKRMTFWRKLLKNISANLKLIFVSDYFAEEVMEDLGSRLPEQHYAIIHNPINTEIFAYQEKSPDQRKKVLSIRPYASRKYANDLGVQAILSLSKKPWFNDLEFRIIGDGELFDQTLAPLHPFNNVHVEQRFLNHAEIAALHRQYGIFLCPTRMDAQGVSRDEAMSSGLVPVTNRVAAIPEFVDRHCGILAEAEDAEGMAAGIADLYEHPEKFLAMSRAAAERVRKQSSSEQIIQKELDLFSATTDTSTAAPHIVVSRSPGETALQADSRGARIHSFLSFDVEALPGRASENSFDLLVWGRNGSEEFGIRRICNILSQHKIKANFMIDLSATLLYGDAVVQKVFDYLLSEGHEVHTHLHSEWVMRSWGLDSGLDPIGFDQLDYDIARGMLSFSAWKYQQFTGRDSTVFRPGAFLFNRQTLLAAKDAGFTAISSFKRARINRFMHFENSPSSTEPFLWDNGLIEIPVDFSPEPLSSSKQKYLDAFDLANLKKNKTFNLVLHSWSLAKRDEQGYHPALTPEHEERLHQICYHLTSVGAVSGYDEYLSLHNPTEKIATDLCQSTSINFVTRDAVTCPICGTMISKLILTNDVCPGCGSRSRHRQLRDVIQTVGNPFEGKSIIACHATPMERQAFLNNAKNVFNFDVRPVSYVDKQMDIQDMNCIADGSFDCFFALHVLNHVKDDIRALSEIARVIKAGGVAVLSVPYREHEITSACADITEHYGVEALEKFDVGTYRRYGESDFITLLEQYFSVCEYEGLDRMTGQRSKVFFATKPANTDSE